MVEQNPFPANLRYQARVSQCGEHDWSAHNEENGNYNDYPSLSHFTNEH